MQIAYQQYTHAGKRENNEDFIISIPENGVFAVCDGVGGRNKGEIASELVCRQILDYFESNDLIDAERFGKLIQSSVAALSVYVKKHNGSEGLATTLVFLQLKSVGAFVAHMGDSRLYHVRNGEILFRTTDHSLVNELVASGFITPEEALTHPKRNVITRAIQPSEDVLVADIAERSDIQPGDFFLLCSDGVLEAVDTTFINQFFLNENSVSMILEMIKNACAEKSGDNNSAILIKVETV